MKKYLITFALGALSCVGPKSETNDFDVKDVCINRCFVVFDQCIYSPDGETMTDPAICLQASSKCMD